MAQIAKSDPLQDFVKICDKVHLYTPISTQIKSTEKDTGLVIVCGWTFAHPRHISKYLTGYRTLYPGSQILLLQVETNNLLFRPDAWQMPMLFNPAAKAVRSYVDKTDHNPRILAHAYSNGGTHSIVQLAEAYRSLYSEDFPISALIMDSTPGVPRWNETLRALLSGLPKTFFARALGYVTIQGMLVTTTFLHYSGLAELAGSKLYRTLNDPVLGSAFTKATVPRTYIHSKDDTMILSEDVEAHAAKARSMFAEQGAETSMVTVEAFVGTAHVNHMSSDPLRYWRIVRETWDKANP